MTDTSGKQPYQSGLLSRIKAIHFPEVTGLPVRIFSRSGLERTNPFDWNSCTISIWLRVSSETLSAVIANGMQREQATDAATTGGTFDYQYIASLPIITFGQPGSYLHFAGSPGGSLLQINGPTTPSYLGIQCGLPFRNLSPSDLDDGNVFLTLRLAAPDNGGFAHLDVSPTGWADTFPEYFMIGPERTAAWIGYGPDIGFKGYLTITPDVWHHVFISWQVQGTRGTAYAAIDGQIYPMGNYGYPSGVGPDARYMSAVGTLGPNDIAAGFAMFTSPVDPDTGYATTMSPGFSGVDVGPSIGITTPSSFSIYTDTIDLAELQIFSGRCEPPDKLDLFITSTGTPRDPKAAEVWYGTKPDILLHPATSWISGQQVGRLHGGFSTFGQPIIPLSPDPQIGT